MALPSATQGVSLQGAEVVWNDAHCRGRDLCCPQDGVLRGCGDPVARLEEDSLRCLRAVRFAATLGLQIEPATQDAIRAVSPRCGHSAGYATPPKRETFLRMCPGLCSCAASSRATMLQGLHHGFCVRSVTIGLSCSPLCHSPSSACPAFLCAPVSSLSHSTVGNLLAVVCLSSWPAAGRCAPPEVAAERIWKELVKLSDAEARCPGCFASGMRLASDLGLLRVLLPEAAAEDPAALDALELLPSTAPAEVKAIGCGVAVVPGRMHHALPCVRAVHHCLTSCLATSERRLVCGHGRCAGRAIV
jgi:hypothetical protein